MSIRLRLALVVALVASLLVVAGGLLFADVLSSAMHATVRHDLERDAGRLVSDLQHRRLVLGASRPVVDPSRDQSILQVVRTSGRVGFTTERAGRTSMLSGSQLARAASGPVYVTRDRPGWASPRLLFARPAPGRPGWLIVVGSSLDELDDTLSRLELLLLGGGAVVVTLATVGAYALAGRALRPVDRLRAEADEISSTLPARRLAAPTTRDEVARLADTLNRLLDRLQGALARQREFIAVASHELRTPLAVLQAEVEIAGRPGRSADELRRALAVLGPRVEQLTRLSDDLLLLARGDEGALEVHVALQPLEPLVARSLALLAPVADAHGVVLAIDGDRTVAAAVDAGRFQQVVDNLVTNALVHGAGGRYVEVRLRGDGDATVVEVRDHGPGFETDILPRAFERFARSETAAGRRGAGLGLAIVQLIVEAHRGSVAAANATGGGASVTVRLPVGSAAPPLVSEPPAAAPATAAGARRAIRR